MNAVDRLKALADEAGAISVNMDLLKKKTDAHYAALAKAARANDGKEVDRIRMIVHDDVDQAVDAIVRLEHILQETETIARSG